MNSRIMIGIISYLPNDLVVRPKRIDAHRKQLVRLNELYPSIDVVQMNQQYSDKDVEKCNSILDNGLREVRHEMHGKLGISRARNNLLKIFYNSDYEFMMLMDDDTLIYPYYDSSRFFDDLLNWADKDSIGMIRPLVPSMVPFKKTNYEQKDVIRDYWILRSSLGINPAGMIILSNLKKNFGHEVYFKEDMKSENCEGYEDYDFVLQLRELHIPTYMCKQIVINSLIPDGSVMFQDNQRKQNHIRNICSVYDCHPKLHIYYQIIDGKIKSNVSKLNIWQSEYIPRSKPYEIPSNLVPKNVPDDKSTVRRKKLI